MDGDTFVLQTTEGSFKVRMDGIDAPEKDQPFGDESKKFMDKYLYKECLVTVKGYDKYQRALGVLFVDGVNLNLLSVQEGFSWHYKKYSTDKALSDAEISARREKKGLWLNSDVMPPWDWRHRIK